MLKNTFLHVPGIGTISEKKIWDSGVSCWDDFIEMGSPRLSPKKVQSIKDCIDESTGHLENTNPGYFAQLLPSNQYWRLFPEFRDSVAYLDIETTGLDSWIHEITMIGVYDGKSITHYLKGKNLADFEEDIKKYKVIVTYNGKCFDIPFIESNLGVSMDHVHIDLRYVLASLGYRGGLKGCERMLSINRGDLEGIDGYFAVLLWDDFRRKGNQESLDTLLAYNTLDVVNLETLMVAAYNRKLTDTPFLLTHQLATPPSPESAFKADRETIERIKRDSYGYSRWY